MLIQLMSSYNFHNFAHFLSTPNHFKIQNDSGTNETTQWFDEAFKIQYSP